MIYTIEKIATLIGARRYGDHDANVRWLLTDSRSLCFPEETLFFALHTKRNDGHRYVDELYRRGVRSFVVEQVPEHPQADANYLKVPSTLAALQRLAERHRDEFDIPIVGITGSNGKTMVKEWLYQLLLPSQKIVRSPRSFNSQIGVPLSVWLLNEQTEIGIFEAGISQPGEMMALHDIIQPTIGVLTCLAAAHQENFRSMEEKCQEKLELMHDTQALIYPMDDNTVSRCIRRMRYTGEKIGWSRTDEQAPFYVRELTEGDASTRVSYRYKDEEGEYTIPFTDVASVEDSIVCAVVALRLGLTAEQIAERMPMLEPIAMRLEVKQGQHGCTLINDSYNSDINSLDIALDFMSRRGGKKTLVLSDIDQSGEQPAELYRQVNELCVKRGVDKFIGIGEELLAQSGLFLVGDKYFFATTQEFLSSPVFAQLHDEVILLKGSRRFGFEHITELLEQKVHETILEVNLNAVVDNLNYYRSFMKPETKLVCMVKADAYGAGAVEVAKTLQEHRVDYLAVAVADEGVTLRKAGITANIMVMNPEMTAFKTMFDYDLEPEVYSFRLLDALIKAARKEGITGWPVHIKLDTGMHRLGFNVNEELRVKSEEFPSGVPKGAGEGTAVANSSLFTLHSSFEIDELIDRLRHQQAVIPRSVFSHFVGSDSDEFDDFSARQFQLFDEGSRRLQAAFSHKILRHMDNSAGIEHFPERQMDMCRLGLGLYGVNPLSEELIHSSLHCVSTLKTTILQLRHVKAGDSVGYSRRTVLERDSVIGAIPIGYADGLDRLLGNRHGYCLVGGKKAEYVGNICMDVAMIDVTDIDCQEGDMVEIFGEHLPVTVLSNIIDTIPYEVLTGVSNRVKRVYYQD
ncbi:MAG: bifunctional UDP-N-acetylmuramoyl-tripeptide:D-alanyl-D-alanine ligase/alanine racemase [Prevotella sp.]|nr:bifunctional UDP-N-acetylmuramoyl-tripeptide:D-alanyl-D-alanine ligase/alanine racemase [Prevotella sp.]